MREGDQRSRSVEKDWPPDCQWVELAYPALGPMNYSVHVELGIEMARVWGCNWMRYVCNVPSSKKRTGRGGKQ